MKKNTLDKITEETKARYTERLNKYGYNIKTLGWGSEEQQSIRFNKFINSVNVAGKKLLDIGCGFGDLLDYCIVNNCMPAHYIGWDINSELINIATQRHDTQTSKFETINLYELNETKITADIAVMLGLLNFNLSGTCGNVDYSMMMIEKAFSCVKETLVVDFLSSHTDPNYEKEDFVFYHNPEEMLKFTLELTPNVSLFHDYPPIPQKEFMLILNK